MTHHYPLNKNPCWTREPTLEQVAEVLTVARVEPTPELVKVVGWAWRAALLSIQDNTPMTRESWDNACAGLGGAR